MDDTKTVATASEHERLAYEVWAFVASEDYQLTKAYLYDHFDVRVSIDNLRQWKHRYEWETEKRRALLHMLPGFNLRILGELALAALDGARTIRRQAAGRWTQPIANERQQLHAATIALDRMGYAPRHVEARALALPDVADNDNDHDGTADPYAALHAGWQITDAHAPDADDERC